MRWIEQAAEGGNANAQAIFGTPIKDLDAVALLARRARQLGFSGAVVMHPGPMNRGIEIDSDVADGPFSVILDQVTNGVAVRMAVLQAVLG